MYQAADSVSPSCTSVISLFFLLSQIICFFTEKRETCCCFLLRNSSVSSSVSSMETGVENLWRCADWNQLTFVVDSLVLHEACVLAHITLWLNSEFWPNAIRVVHTSTGRTKALSLQKVCCTWQSNREQKMVARDLPSSAHSWFYLQSQFGPSIFIIDHPSDFSRSQSGFASLVYFNELLRAGLNIFLISCKGLHIHTWHFVRLGNILVAENVHDWLTPAGRCGRTPWRVSRGFWNSYLPLLV